MVPIFSLAVSALVGCAPAEKPAHLSSITIDLRATKEISPYIYGINQPDWDKFPFVPTFVRQGGNRMTAYNWTTNASNAGSDYQNQNDGYMGASDEPGWTVSHFLHPAQEHGAAALLTVQMAGYVSADKNADGDVNKTPDYLHVRFKPSLPSKPGPFTLKPSPNAPAVYQDEFVNWVNHIKSPDSPVWYSLDNEPDIWAGTHSRIVKKTPTYAEFLARSIEFATAIKKVAPDTKVFGWSSYGWQGFRHFQNASDANGRDFMDFYLSSMQAAEKQGGKRLLDVLDLHWYPEAKGGGQRISDNNDKPGTAEARIQAPRSLWDPSYVEDSWIADSTNHSPIKLIPDTFERIAKNYPGTKLAFTEYSYGGSKVVSGLIAEADVLGIFGEYGLFAASNWGVSPADTAIVGGFEAFLNYDGKGGKFGPIGLGVTGTSAPVNSVYASKYSKDGKKVLIVAINKSKEAQQFRFTFKGLSPTSGTGFVRDADAFHVPKQLSVRIDGEDAIVTLPPLSVADVSVSE